MFRRFFLSKLQRTEADLAQKPEDESVIKVAVEGKLNQKNDAKGDSEENIQALVTAQQGTPEQHEPASEFLTANAIEQEAERPPSNPEPTLQKTLSEVATPPETNTQPAPTAPTAKHAQSFSPYDSASSSKSGPDGRVENIEKTVVSQGDVAQAIRTDDLQTPAFNSQLGQAKQAQAPIVVAQNIQAPEDSVIDLNIRAQFNDTDNGNETMQVTLFGVPDTATLNKGIRQSDGSWKLTQAELEGLQLTPAAHNNEDISLEIHTTVTEENGKSYTLTNHMQVDLVGVADAPVVTAESITTREDIAASLDLSAALVDLDGSETLNVTITGLPEGAQLSAGTHNSNGDWVVPVTSLAPLIFTPPKDFSGTIQAFMRATSIENDGDNTHTETPFFITVSGIADIPDLVVVPAQGEEDSQIALHFSGASTDMDGSESVHYLITDMPKGATLSAGSAQKDGSYLLSQEELLGLSLSPPADSDTAFSLTIQAISSEDGTQASATASLPITLNAVADVPIIKAVDGGGKEDSPIALFLKGTLSDMDGSESLSFILSNIPEGATLSAGEVQKDGSYLLSQEALAGLTITPPQDFSGSFTLTAKAIATEATGGETASSSTAIHVHVSGIADIPDLVVVPAQGEEDSQIALHFSGASTDMDGSESVHYLITDMPKGATLSAGSAQKDGSYLLSQEELLGLSLSPPADSDTAFSLTIQAISSEDGTQASATASLPITLNAVADVPIHHVEAALVKEDQYIALNIKAESTDSDGSETVTVTLDNLPEGAKLSAGEPQADGSWVIEADALPGLGMHVPQHLSGEYRIIVTTRVEDHDKSVVEVVDLLPVTIEAVADAPKLFASSAPGMEDKVIDLVLINELVDQDGSEQMTHLSVSGLPKGASLSHGEIQADGSVQLSMQQLDDLSITPPPNSHEDFSLDITAFTQESSDGDTASTRIHHTIHITGVADTPILSVENPTGNEGTHIALPIAGKLVDGDGSETLSYLIEGVPSGARLTVGKHLGSGRWELDADQITQVEYIPKRHMSGEIELNISAISTESDGDTASISQSMTLNITAVADRPHLKVVHAKGQEDTEIPLQITSSLHDRDGSEELTLRIENLPKGAVLNAGEPQADGSWIVPASGISNLTVTPPKDSSEDFFFTVTAIATEASNGDVSAAGPKTVQVRVKGVADAAIADTQAAQGLEDQWIDMDFTPMLSDIDGSESLSVLIYDLPEGVTLSGGTFAGGGRWSFTPEALEGLRIHPPADFSGTLYVKADLVTQEEDGHMHVHHTTYGVEVEAVADQPLIRGGASGLEDTDIPLRISVASMDQDGSESLGLITINDLPEGAVLNVGEQQEDGSYLLTHAQLKGLTITPPHDSNEDFTITVQVTATDTNGDIYPHKASLTVRVTGVADDPTVYAEHAQGERFSQTPITIDGAVSDIDGSESHALLITGLPRGFALSAGMNNGNGSWVVLPGQEEGLSLIAPYDFTGIVSLDVATIASEDDGDVTLGTFASFVVDIISPDGGGGRLHDLIFDEDGGSYLGLGHMREDVYVDNVPEGAWLNVATQMGPNRWKVSAKNVEDVCIFSAPDSNENFTIHVSTNKAYLGEMDVYVQGVADMPVFTHGDGTTAYDGPAIHASGAEDTAIAVEAAALFADTDGSETLSYRIEDLPKGFIPTVGYSNGNGSWSLTAAQMAELTILPIDDISGTFSFTLHAVSTEDDGDWISNSATVKLTVTPVADQPTISTAQLAIDEDETGTITLAVQPADRDGSEIITSITISHVPEGAILHGAADQGNGSYSVDPNTMDALSITPPPHSDANFSLKIVAESMELETGATAISTSMIPIQLTAVADVAQLSAQNVSGLEDATAIALNISTDFVDQDGSELMSIVIDGVPDNTFLNHGVNNGDGSWTLKPADLQGLAYTPAPDFAETIEMHVTAHVMESSNQNMASIRAPFSVEIVPVADTPTFTLVQNITKYEDQSVPITIRAASSNDVDGSETLSLSIENVPEGASFSAGKMQGDGTWLVDEADFAGLTMTPPKDFSGTINLNTALIATDNNGDSTSVEQPVRISLRPVADTPTLSAVQSVQGEEDQAIALPITQASSNDTDGSESLLFNLIGFPSGTTFSTGSLQQDGSWEIPTQELEGLTFTPPEHYSGAFTLTANLTASEGGDSQHVAQKIAVTIDPVADAPIMQLEAQANGAAGDVIALDIAGQLTDASENLSFLIENVPDTASFTAGSKAPEGHWQFSAKEIGGLGFIAPEGSEGSLTLRVSALSTESDGSVAQTEPAPLTVMIVPPEPEAEIKAVSSANWMEAMEEDMNQVNDDTALQDVLEYQSDIAGVHSEDSTQLYEQSGM